MKTLTTTLLCILLSFALNACTSRTVLEPQKTLRDPGTARLHFIRPSTFVGALQSMRVTVNDKKVGNLGVGTHLYVDRPPGEYNLVVEHEFDLGKWELNINIAAEKEYYFKIVPTDIGVIPVGASNVVVTGDMIFAAVSEDEGKALISATED